MSDKYPITSFYLSPLMKERLEVLCKKLGESKSSVIRRLINDAYMTEIHQSSHIRGCYMPESKL